MATSKKGTKKSSAKKTSAKKSSAKKKSAPAKKAATGRKAIVGVLTNEGVECQAMRQDRTKALFTLVPRSKLTGFNDGDRVRVTGTIQAISFCMQGTTISIATITRVK